jgi:hypothetical protein
MKSKPAGICRRLASTIVDFIISFVLQAIVSFVNGNSDQRSKRSRYDKSDEQNIVVFLVTSILRCSKMHSPEEMALCPFQVYSDIYIKEQSLLQSPFLPHVLYLVFAIGCISSSMQGTLPMRICGLHFRYTNGEKIDLFGALSLIFLSILFMPLLFFDLTQFFLCSSGRSLAEMFMGIQCCEYVAKKPRRETKRDDDSDDEDRSRSSFRTQNSGRLNVDRFATKNAKPKAVSHRSIFQRKSGKEEEAHRKNEAVEQKLKKYHEENHKFESSDKMSTEDDSLEEEQTNQRYDSMRKSVKENEEQSEEQDSQNTESERDSESDAVDDDSMDDESADEQQTSASQLKKRRPGYSGRMVDKRGNKAASGIKRIRRFAPGL